ncbi:alpha/beta fold hydrolase [Williamsia sp. M5A3_1d]
MIDPRAEWVVRSAGAEVAVFEYGNSGSDTTLLLVHGYPNNHTLFEKMIDEIGDRARIIAYDTRGGGQTVVDHPESKESFTMDRLADDVYAVVDSIPDLAGPVHVFAHDWGSMQMWKPLQDPRASTVFASYTSVSGFSVDHLREVSRRQAARPIEWPALVAQLARSWYVWGFLTPGLNRFVPSWFMKAAPGDPAPVPDPFDMQRGVELYRANIMARMMSGEPPRCDIPTLIVVPLKDRVVSPGLMKGIDQWIPDLTVLEVDAKHWWPWSHPCDAVDALFDHIARN